MFTKASSSPVPRHLLQLLQLSINSQSLKLIQETHARICHVGLHQHPAVITNLINAYSRSKNPVHSRTLFNSIQLKDVCLWNTLINAYVENNLHHECFVVFSSMCQNVDSSPDEFTFSTLAKVSGEIGDLLAGKWVHGKCIKLGLLTDTVLANSLMSAYGKCDGTQEARKLFDEMPQRTVSSWNIMLSRYVNGGNAILDSEVWEFVKCMLTEGLNPNEFTLSNLLPLCGSRAGMFDHGRELHCYIIRSEMNLYFISGIHLDCCLIDMYSRYKKVNWARLVFDQMRFRNVFAWTTMMSGYLQNGNPEETVHLFCRMQRMSGVEPNEVSVLTLLSACSLIAGLLGVELIHGLSVRKGFVNHTSLCNSFIDMYSKNGLLTSSRKVFDHDCQSKDAISWGCIISGCGLHGQGQAAIDLYDKMLKTGIKPDAISVVGVLSACSKSGLVEKGLDAYNKAITVFGFEPTVEICSCVVDLLGRSGQLNEALIFIKAMRVEPGPSVWGALVSAFVAHTSYETRVLGYKSLIETEPENASNYVSLSNFYATSREWDCLADIRRIMKVRNLRKLPGCSWITINNKTHSFFVADKKHPASDKMYEILNELILVMKRP
ncbi:hypothetical protein E3N88_32511 [Mikania micrantha]|uniref:Pentatricopeptide repeat-containing protein n=1 Tax=Mikania micrantha TaxID=192012 RepID=A0A5N6M9Y7_9ASTR|nr:hypothetical protein E3N88_32511 [Mikania micrantha]